ncbi:probable fibrosin-1 isoform X3 [Podarcis raffonei]|uniref:probable fibrosin-1 isoform X3 n=1 Tax=Podarcis raffonei TaxID=65483 RepID=UPI0023296D8D|nr:probable fibrosin-1 isoform X3 [Podarcis raffonei]
MEGTAAAPAPCWSGGGGSSSRTRRQRRCSRRDRESRCTRRRGGRPGDGSRRGLLSSSSSGSDSEGPSPPAPVAPGKGRSLQQQQRRRRRPLRRRKRPSGSSCSRDEEEEEEEEDLIDGFAIASFVSLEALEDATLKTPERLELRMKHSGKRKRGEGNNSEPEDEDGSSEKGRSRERAVRKRTKKRHKEPSLQSYLETGYICDTESDPEEQASVDDLEQSFTVSTSKAASGPIGALNGSCEAKLSVIPKVSGLERSQERNYEADRDPLLVPFLPKEPPSQAAAAPAPAQALPPSPPAPPPTRTRAQTPNAVRGTPQPKGQLPPMPQGGAIPHNLTQSQLHMKVPPFASQTQAPYAVGLDLSTGGCSRGAAHPKPILPPCSPSSSQLPHRPSTPSLALPPHAFPPTLRPPSHHHPGMFTPSPGLPPPPPLLQVAGHPAAAAAISEQELIRQDLSSRFLTAQGGADMGAAAIRPLAFQFHQHNHQHQHTHQHTHQHFTPFPPGMVPTASPAMYEKYPGKMDGLLRHNFYAAFPPTVSGISPVLPPAVTFGSLQGAFQPKSTNPDLPSRLGTVPPTLSQKGTQLTDPFRPTLRKPGKWCAMHVRVAYMILRHQEKMKVGWACATSPLHLRTVMGCGAAPAGSRQRVAASNGRSLSHSALLMSVLDPGCKAGSLVQGDPQKLDFRNDLLTGLPGTGAFGSLPHSQELARPATLFTASGAIHHPGSGTSFGPAGTPHGSFLSPSPHIGKSWRTRMPGPVGQDPASSIRLFTPLLASFPDPFGRPPSFASLGALSNGAFGGLGNPSFNSSAVFGQKDSPGAPAFPSPHEAWNRLHRTPPSFPTAPAWPKGGAGDGAERGGTQHEKESEKPEGPVIKDEKDRDALFSRHPLRASPATPTPKNLALAHEEPPGRSHIPTEREHRYGSPAGSGHASRSPYPELPLKKEVKVKEEPELTGFEGALRTGPPFHSTLHVSHPLGTLAVFERPQAGTGGSVSPYLVAAPPSAASYAALEAWREPYHRGLELHPLQRLPRYLETPSPAATAAEDYERARLYGLAPPPHPSLMAYPRHPNGLLAKATPAAAAAAAAAAVGLLSAPPPLIPASNARPCSPRRAPDIRELAAYKDRDSR